MLDASAVPLNTKVVSLVISSVLDEPVSVVIEVNAGAFGAPVSIVTLSALEAELLLPAVSVTLAVMLYVPSVSALTVKLQSPSPSTVAVPNDVLPPNNSSVPPASPVPVNVGVVSLVTLSVSELPVSLEAARSGVDGASGAVVSIVTLKLLELPLLFPAASVAVAVNVCVPAVSVVPL